MVHAGANDYFYLHDHLYSTVALVNSAGAVVERYEYDVYGKVSILSPNYEVRTTSSVANPYLFAGYRFDANTGLYHTLYRSYNPYTGRWLQHDPLGYADSMSLYEYVMSNPTRYTDPWGLNSVPFNYLGGAPDMSEAEAEIIVANIWIETPNCYCRKNMSPGNNIKVNAVEIIGWYAGFGAQNIANLFQGLQDGAITLANLSVKSATGYTGRAYEMVTGKPLIPEIPNIQWAKDYGLKQSDFVYGTHKFINSTIATAFVGAALNSATKAGTVVTVVSGPGDEAGNIILNSTDEAAGCLDELTSISDDLSQYIDDTVRNIKQTEQLPNNYITKSQARKLGWNPKKGNLQEVCPGKSIGGDIFRNKEGLLPVESGRIWYEADIGYTGGFRGSQRLLYSNDGLFYFTLDHYETFIPIE